MTIMQHQYVDRRTGQVVTERLFGDAVVNAIYSEVREKAPILYRAAIAKRTSKLLAFLNYDFTLGTTLSGNRGFLQDSGIDFNECVDPPASLNTARKLFERKIRYWDCRPMPGFRSAVVSPADSRMLAGSLEKTDKLFLKGKFFDCEELLGKPQWLETFRNGDFAIFRLTPDKYHYNHTPVAGIVEDFYEISGDYHSCNPTAIVQVATPYSKNKRTVTIINTDVPGGTEVGIVAMIEVTALMIGDIVQCYSSTKYDDPQPIARGMFIERGCPKSLYRPGSSTDVLIFESGRIKFDPDIIENMQRTNVQSRFSQGFGRPLVETDVRIRSRIAVAADREIPYGS
ncbi:MAG TPA: phosphatidylserine decarboxylase [Blastocatellia bacterium]|nr:phosphatidylserine decarboxylase [Blastocatellia bacterium]